MKRGSTMGTKKAKRPTAEEKRQAMQMALNNSLEAGKSLGFSQGYEAAKADFRKTEMALKSEERQQQFKALASLGRVADQMAITAEAIAKLVLSLNGHL